MSGNGKNGNYTAAQFIAAIPGSGGIITTIASRVGCAWSTAKKYITKYVTVQQAYEDECAKVVDLAESVVIGSIKDKDVQTAKWYLTMKGAERGYVQTQRSEVSGPDGGPVKQEVTGNVGVMVYIPDNGRDNRDPTAAGAAGSVPGDEG